MAWRNRPRATGDRAGALAAGVVGWANKYFWCGCVCVHESGNLECPFMYHACLVATKAWAELWENAFTHFDSPYLPNMDYKAKHKTLQVMGLLLGPLEVY